MADKPWLRQNKETGPAWEGFVTYRDMDPVERTVIKASKIVGKSPKLFYRWSAKYNWNERAIAWDNEQGTIQRRAQLQEIAAMSRRHARQAGAGMTFISSMVATALKRIKEETTDKEDPKGLDALENSELFALVLKSLRSIESLSKVERAARGIPETWIMLSEMSDEQLEAYTLGLLSERAQQGFGFGPDGDEEEGLTDALPEQDEDIPDAT